MKDSVDAHLDLWQRELPDLDRRVEGITVRLQKLARILDEYRHNALAGHGLQWWEFKTLHMLRRGGPPYQATPGALAKALGMSAAALTNRLDALERQRLVRRSTDRDDRRKVLASLTPAGQAAWERGIGEIQRVENTLIRALPPEDQLQLEDLLRRLVLAAEADVENG